MWSVSNDYNLFNVGGDRTLGEYTEIQRQLQMVYDLAKQLGLSDDQIYGDIDPANSKYELAKGDSSAALAYGLKPYIVAPEYEPKSLVPLPMDQQKVPTVSSQMQPNMLRAILKRIVEEA